MKYFYIENEEQKGPVELEELYSLSISEATLIWHEGLEDWTQAKDIDSLKPLLKKTTPPRIPVSNLEPPKIQTQNTIYNQPTNVETKTNRQAIIISTVAVSVLLLIGGIYFITKNGDSGQDFETSNEVTNNYPIDDYSNEHSGGNQSEYQESNYTQTSKKQQHKTRELSEDEIRQNLYNKEKNNPATYLSADGTYRVNLAANTIVEGTIYNNASIAGFKNVKLTAKFYSKTDILLGKESFLVMDFVGPNGSLPFRYKIPGWWENIDHWTLSVSSAEAY